MNHWFDWWRHYRTLECIERGCMNKILQSSEQGIIIWKGGLMLESFKSAMSERTKIINMQIWMSYCKISLIETSKFSNKGKR